MAIHANPKKGTSTGNICAFCKCFEGDIRLKRQSMGFVEYDDKIKGRCLANGNAARISSAIACQKFEMSYEASRYAK